MGNDNAYETSNLENMTNEVPAQDGNDSNKNKEHENVCPRSFKLKEESVSISTIYNEWFGLGSSAIIIPCGINSLETLHPEYCRNKNSASRRKLLRLRFISTTVAKLASYTCNLDALVIDTLEEVIQKLNALFLGWINLSNSSKNKLN